MTNQIFVLSETKCPYAMMMKKWFNNKKIQIQEILIDNVSDKKYYTNKYNIENLKSPFLIINNNNIGSYMDLLKQESYVEYLLGIKNLEED